MTSNVDGAGQGGGIEFEGCRYGGDEFAEITAHRTGVGAAIGAGWRVISSAMCGGATLRFVSQLVMMQVPNRPLFQRIIHNYVPDTANRPPY